MIFNQFYRIIFPRHGNYRCFDENDFDGDLDGAIKNGVLFWANL